jgi:hypothetical protein
VRNSRFHTSSYGLYFLSYSGILFLQKKLQKNYLEFRYLGGEDWHKKQSKILNLLDSFLFEENIPLKDIKLVFKKEDPTTRLIQLKKSQILI